MKNNENGIFQVRAIKFLAPIVLLSMFLFTRVPALGQFVTADEALWLRSSANFYYAIRHADWGGTFRSDHPAVTTMWAGAIGFHLIFPDYAEVGESEISDFHLRHLLLRKGVNPLEVLAAGRGASIILNALAFISLWPLSKKLLGSEAAFLGLSLIALDPFMLGHQRLLHQDGTLSSFMLLSLMSFLLFRQNKNKTYLILSAVAGGIAALTKSPAWFIFPLLFLFQSWDWLARPRKKRGEIIRYIIPLVIWLVLALLSVYVFYPAMWVGSVSMLTGMVQYALDSAGGLYSGPVFFLGNVFPNADLQSFSWIFYVVSGLWRSTPLSLLGLTFAGYSLIKFYGSDDPSIRKNLYAIIIFGLGYAILMSLGTKKFDRYLLPALGPMLMVSGWGIAKLFGEIRNRLNHKLKANSLILIVIFIAAFSAQVWGLTSARPYYINYFNPLLGGSKKALENIQLGWGEGMEKAANFLMHEPDINSKQVAAWYSTSFNLIYEFDADHIPITLNLPQEHLDELLSIDYLVIYLHQRQRETPKNLLFALQDLQPIYTVLIDGLPYVQIYRP